MEGRVRSWEAMGVGGDEPHRVRSVAHRHVLVDDVRGHVLGHGGLVLAHVRDIGAPGGGEGGRRLRFLAL